MHENADCVILAVMDADRMLTALDLRMPCGSLRPTINVMPCGNHRKWDSADNERTAIQTLVTRHIQQGRAVLSAANS